MEHRKQLTAAATTPSRHMRSKSRVCDVQIASSQGEQQELIRTSCGTCDQNCQPHEDCDACPHCNDTCSNPTCLPCQEKIKRSINVECREPETSWLFGAFASVCPGKNNDSQSTKSYSMCQLRRHNTVDSAWILVGNEIFDATPYIRSHPGGTAIILKKAGGAVDCTLDMTFHSKKAQREWRRYKVGNLCRCPRSS